MAIEDELISAAMEPDPTRFFKLHTGSEGPELHDYLSPSGRFAAASKERDRIRSKMIDKSLESQLDPVSRSQYTGVTGRDPLQTATQDEFTKTPTTEPSQVPHYGINPQGYGSPTPQQPQDTRMAMTPGTGEMHPYNPQFLNESPTQTPNDPLAPQTRQVSPPLMNVTSPHYQPPVAAPQGPLTPQQGAPVNYDKSTLDPQGQINPVQRDLYKIDLHRMSSPYGMRGAGGGTPAGVQLYQQKYNDAVASLQYQHPDWDMDHIHAEAKAYASDLKGKQDKTANTESLMGHRADRQTQNWVKIGLMKEYQDARIAHMQELDARAAALAKAGHSKEDIALMRLEETKKWHRAIIANLLRSSELDDDQKSELLAELTSMGFDKEMESVKVPQKFMGMQYGETNKVRPKDGAKKAVTEPQTQTAPAGEGPWSQYSKDDPRSKPENWKQK